MALIVEKRSLTRRTSLEELCQSAIDTVRLEVVDDAVSDAMEVVSTVPADLRVRTLRALHKRVSLELAPQAAAKTAKRSSTALEAGEALFAKTGRAAA